MRFRPMINLLSSFIKNGYENFTTAVYKTYSISNDGEARGKAIKLCKDSLALAELIGANCCVNVTGSRGNSTVGPHPDNLKKETFEMIVQTTREIIDEIKPTRTFFAIESLPWSYPYSVSSYLKLIKAIDRKRLAVNLDPVNMINSPLKCWIS